MADRSANLDNTLSRATRWLPALRRSLSLAARGDVEGAAETLNELAIASAPGSDFLQGLPFDLREQNLLRSLLRFVQLPKEAPERILTRAVIEYECGRYHAAVRILRGARRDAKTSSEMYLLEARCFTAIGDFSSATDTLAAAARLYPLRSDIQASLGALYQNIGDSSRAVDALMAATALKPDDWYSFFELGNAHKHLGNQNLAIDAFSRALQINSRHAESWNNRGATYQTINADPQAIADFDNAVALDRRHLFAWINKGVSLSKLTRYEESLNAFEAAAAIDPSMGEIYHNMGLIYLKLERNAEALSMLDAALLVQPLRTDWLLSKGNAYVALAKYEEAVDAYRQCIAANPANTDAHINMAGALQELALHRQAIATLDEALAKRPDYPEAQWNKANSLLAFGPSREAWEAHEQRLHISVGEPLPDYGLPLLGGDEIGGRKLLVQWEQRYGDVLQMLRYVPSVTAVCDAVWQVSPPMLELVRSSFPGNAVCGQNECPPGLDARVAYTSLPLAMKTFSVEDIPATVPYLRSSVGAREKWCEVRAKGHLNVGISWRGNRQPPGRSIPLQQFASIFDVSGARFVSLQFDATAEEEKILGLNGVLGASQKIGSFDDTAALVEQLDLVVTIDTAVAHLSGALAAKTWVLLKFGADWRWMLERSDSPWYPTATLFRQQSLGNWKDVLAIVRERLAFEVMRVRGEATQ